MIYTWKSKPCIWLWKPKACLLIICRRNYKNRLTSWFCNRFQTFARKLAYPFTDQIKHFENEIREKRSWLPCVWNDQEYYSTCSRPHRTLNKAVPREKLKGAQCSEPVKSRVPRRWFGWKKEDFLVTREQKLGARGHWALLEHSLA